MNTDEAAGRGSAEPIDVEFEPAAERERPYRRARESGGVGFGTALFLSVLSAGAGAAGGAIAPRLPEVNAALNEALPASAVQPAASVPAPGGALEQRVATIEGIM